MNRPDTINPPVVDACCSGESRAQTAGRAALVKQAFWLEWITVGWMVVEAAVAIGSGLAAGSITLLAFGIDSVIE
jgi:hypothetical protein